MKETMPNSFEIRNRPIFSPEAWKQLEAIPVELHQPIRQFLEDKMVEVSPILGSIRIELVEKGEDAIVRLGFVQENEEDNEITLELRPARSGEWKVLDYKWDQWYSGDDTDDGSDMEDDDAAN